MAKSYGKSWWGDKWLEALYSIDIGGRLGRGKTYANSGKVKDLKIEGNVVSALVKGSTSKPYKIIIKFKQIDEIDAKLIINEISHNRTVISSLLNGKLPEPLLEIFHKQKISLFIEEWKSIKSMCSCPDYSVPCKHIAAVFFMLANEIDKDPILIFKLRGFDIVKNLLDRGINILSARDNEIPPISKLTTLNLNSEISETLIKPDLKKIENLHDKIPLLLTERPYFYNNGDFREPLLKLYKKLTKEKKIYDNYENEEEKKYITHEFTNVKIVFDEIFSLKSILISSQETSLSASNYRQLNQITNFLDEINIATIDNHSYDIKFLFYTYHLAVRLIETGTFIPALFKFSENYYILKYLPYLTSESVKEIIKNLSAFFKNPPVFTIKSYVTDSDEERLNEYSSIIAVTSLFIENHIKNTSVRDNNEDDNIYELFFKTYRFTVSKFYDKETPYTIQKWLSKYNITASDFIPVIKVEEKNDNFLLSYEILPEKDTEYISLKKILYNDNYSDLRIPVLKKFGLIAEHYPALEIVTNSNGSSPLEITGEDFSAFFENILPVFNILGVELLLPKGLDKVIRPVLSITCRSEGGSGFFSTEELTKFDYTIAIGENYLNPSDFLETVKDKSGFIKIKDTFVHIDRKEIEKILKKLEKPLPKQGSNPLQIILEGSYNDVELVKDETIKNAIDKILNPEETKLPSGIKACLRPYQVAGFNYLTRNINLKMGSILADDMGLGKTLQSITVLQSMKEDGKLSKKKALIIVPTALLTNWEKEIEKFSDSLTAVTYYGGKRTESFNTEDKDIVITTYGVMRNDVDILNSLKWTLIIFDEAQNLKNPHAERTKAALKLKADNRIALSGTPVENRLIEFWSIMNIVNRGYLGTIDVFKEKFAYSIEKEFDMEKVDKFKKITAPFFLRRLKSDKSIINDLPEKIEIDEITHLTSEQAKIYQGLVDNALDQIKNLSGMERKGLIFKLLTALKQVCNHPANYLKNDDISVSLSGKSLLLMELLNDIYESGNKVLIFTQFKEMGDILKAQIQKIYNNSVLYIHGGLSRDKRDDAVREFQEGRTSTMILTIKAGGTGLNLTAANYVIHYDLWWNPAVEAQATDRAYRIGQENNVMVYRLITEGTFEEKIDKMLKTKKELAELTVNSGENWISEFSDEDLEELLEMKK